MILLSFDFYSEYYKMHHTYNSIPFAIWFLYNYDKVSNTSVDSICCPTKRRNFYWIFANPVDSQVKLHRDTWYISGHVLIYLRIFVVSLTSVYTPAYMNTRHSNIRRDLVIRSWCKSAHANERAHSSPITKIKHEAPRHVCNSQL